MGNKEGYLEFISSESYKHQIDIWYRTYNISYDKLNLYYDFSMSLYELIEETFLGVDVLYSEHEQKNHFTWCWDKIIENFAKEKIYFKERGNCYEYFWNFYLEAFYFTKMEGNTLKISNYLKKLFNFTHKKTRSELDMVTEIYKIFDQNLKK